jgi:hypothetical protein
MKHDIETQGSLRRGSPIRDPEFLDQLDQLAKEAARVRLLAEEVLEVIPPVEAETYLCKLSHPDGGELLRFCGYEKPPIDIDGCLQLYWNTQRLYVAAQFSGFSVDRVGVIKGNRQSAIKGILATFEQPETADIYWRLQLKQEEAYTKQDFKRAFTLLSLFSVVLPRRGEVPKKAEQMVEMLKQNLLNEIAVHFTQGDPLLVLPLLKLVRRVDTDAFKKLSLTIERLEKDLNKDLALLLAREDTSPDRVARTTRAICGRYLNPGLQIDPAQNVLCSRAAEYVLKKYNRDDSWSPDHDERQSQDSAYLPLVRVLDLPNSILMPSVRILGNRVSDALGNLKKRLSSMKVSLTQRPVVPEPGTRPKAEDVNRAISDGLMVSAAVNDRLRDLLSDAELDEMGAEVPTKFVPWETLPNSLGFIRNVNDGVIDLWKRRSEKRPGAILIFGPPGTGKTTIAKSLLCNLNAVLRSNPGEGTYEEWRFLALSPADFARDGADKIIASAEKLFRRLQRVRRCVVLLDEMEEFLRVRGPGSSQESRLITTAFLPLLQDTVEKREIILIVATNFVGNIDPAVTRRGRFDLVLPLGPPDSDSRAKIIMDTLDPNNDPKRPANIGINLLEEIGINLLEDTYKPYIVKYTMGYTRDEVVDYVSELRSAMRSDRGRQKQEVPSAGSKKSDMDSAVKERLKKELQIELWRIRQERVPMALSGNPGCNWRTFRDETARFKRGVDSAPEGDNSNDNLQDTDPDYWRDPEMPEL